MVPQGSITKYTHIDVYTALGFNVVALADTKSLYHVFGGITFFEILTGNCYPEREDGESDTSWSARCFKWFQSFATQAVFSEANDQNSSEARNLRRYFRNEPIFNSSAAGIDTDNYDVIVSDKPSPGKINSQLRSRTYNEVPIAAYVCLAAKVISHDESTRRLINERSGKGVRIPRVLKEYLFSVRRSTCNKSRIQPVLREIFTQDQLTQLKLSKTIFDVKWLISISGIDALFDFFARLANHPDNYIAFESFDGPISWESGYTTTLTAMSVTEVIKKDITSEISYSNRSGVSRLSNTTTTVPYSYDTINILPGNSYGETVNMTHVLDTQTFGMRHETASGAYLYSDHSVDIRLRNSNTMYLVYLSLRGAGKVHNFVKPVSKDKGRDSSNTKDEINGSNLDTPVGLQPEISGPPEISQKSRGRGRTRSKAYSSSRRRFNDTISSPLDHHIHMVVASLLQRALGRGNFSRF